MPNSENLISGGSEDLSALIDGELPPSQAARLCGHWQTRPQARAQWHAYQLIGDVLRSEDLASAPGHDEDFLIALRKRLADEPVVLAPAALGPWAAAQAAAEPALPQVAVAARASRRGWRTSLAVAAGSSAAVAALLVTQMPGVWRSPSALSAGQAVAAETTSPAAIRPAALNLPAAERRAVASADGMVLDGQLIRDARLDEYLAAHKKFGGSSAPGGPSGFLRNATAEGR